jgi:1,4-dihydroxy-2-naphthoate octaprenyltransferase
MDKKPFSPQILIQSAQPLQILLGLFTYTLGLGLVDYLGKTIQWSTAILGALLIASLVAARNLFKAYFQYPMRLPVDRLNRRDGDGDLRYVETKSIPRIIFLQTALATLAVSATAIVLLIANGAINVSSLLIIIVTICLAVMDFLPPIELCKKGYSELIEAFLLASMSPALAFLLQRSEVHLLLLMLILPLVLVYLAFRVAGSFEYLDYDAKQAGGSMLAHIGWQHCVVIHNLSVLFAFLFVAAFLLFGFPWALAWPIFLALPLGVLQIIQMVRLADGRKPNWRLLWVNALATLLVFIYLITFTLWVK